MTMTKSRPIILSAESVRAILSGTKTQARMVIKPQPILRTGGDGHGTWIKDDKGWRWWGRNWNGVHTPKCDGFYCPYGSPGERLWVREKWRAVGSAQVLRKGRLVDRPVMRDNIIYAADDELDGPWQSPLHLPRWASRITLEITGVRVERVGDISTEDCIAEGFKSGLREYDAEVDLRQQFSAAWDALDAKRGFPWASNPWVWVIEFKKQEASNV